jgi:hypothetical protein
VSHLVVTWKGLAVAHPEFVQWVVQTYGSVPEGPVREDDYERLRAEYLDTYGKNGADT